VTIDQAGNVFTAEDSIDCKGLSATISEFSPPSFTQSVVFDGLFGSILSTDAQGNLYGATSTGGQFDQGFVYKLTCCWTFTDLHDFGAPGDGAYPMAAPLVDAQGNVYGTTSSGGALAQGVVWKISP
jgi:hypothetical protein